MEQGSVLAAGFMLAAGLIVAIGAQNAFVLRQGLRREHVGAVVAFCVAADVTLMAAGVAGIGGVLQRWPGLARVMAYAGAAFLSWYALQAARRAWRPQGLHGESAGAGAARPRRAVLAQAAAFTLLNPHVYLDTVLLVGAVGSRHAPALQPWFVLGAGSASALWFVGLGYGARAAAPWLARPAVWRLIEGLIALMMALLAVALLRWGLQGAPLAAAQAAPA